MKRLFTQPEIKMLQLIVWPSLNKAVNLNNGMYLINGHLKVTEAELTALDSIANKIKGGTE